MEHISDWWHYEYEMQRNIDISDWLWAMRNHDGPKLVTGRRGIGKSTHLAEFAHRLRAEGVPQENILQLDGGSPLAYRLMSCERLIDYINERVSNNHETYVLISDGSAFPDLETTLGTLAAIPRFNVFVTASSRHILTTGLDTYLEGRLAHYEYLPPFYEEPPTRIRQIWREALLYDVCTPVHQPFNTQILSSIACYLSDNVGDPLSLRGISAAVSPPYYQMSPHTIDNYLTALCDAYLVMKCLRYDLAEECILKNNFRCFFTTPGMRKSLFGPAPSEESRRERISSAWFKLRRESDEVFVAGSASKHVDFVTRTGKNYRFWHLEGSEISEVSRESFIAG